MEAFTDTLPVVCNGFKLVQILIKAGYLEHTTPLFTNLNLLKLKNIYYLNHGKFMFKQINNVLPLASKLF